MMLDSAIDVGRSPYDDVGRSPAPIPIEISLSKKIGLCRSTMSVFLSCASSTKIPQGFCFQVKVLVPKRPRSKNKTIFSQSSFLKYCFIFMILLHVERHYTRLRIDRVLYSREVTPMSLELLSCLTQI